MNDKLSKLRRILSDGQNLLVAYSGGVDSSFLLAFAHKCLPPGMVRGILADSPSLPRKAKARAFQTAEAFGLEVIVIQTKEMENPRYVANAPNRCFYCKSALFELMEAEARKLGMSRLAYGENADDARKIRPGARAAENFRVLAPLRDAGLGKAEIREASRAIGLPTADEPAQPCLSSRIAHGIPITADILARVEQAEDRLRALGLREFRVRHRLENNEPVAVLCVNRNEELPESLKQSALQAIYGVGYQKVRIDPEGYRPPEEFTPLEIARALEDLIPGR